VLTDEWDIRGVKKGLEYAILTDEITKAWAGKSGSAFLWENNILLFIIIIFTHTNRHRAIKNYLITKTQSR
jgi:hypothetical protein